MRPERAEKKGRMGRTRLWRAVWMALLLALLSAGLCGCGARTVPQKQIEYIAEEHLIGLKIEGLEGKTVYAEHIPDRLLNTDRVKITLVVRTAAALYITGTEATFHYDRLSRNWAAVNVESWSEPDIILSGSAAAELIWDRLLNG